MYVCSVVYLSNDDCMSAFTFSNDIKYKDTHQLNFAENSDKTIWKVAANKMNSISTNIYYYQSLWICWLWGVVVFAAEENLRDLFCGVIMPVKFLVIFGKLECQRLKKGLAMLT